MSNPYESPSADTSPNSAARPRPCAWQTIIFGVVGAFLGYLCLSIFANLEGWQFYTVRSLVTGETSMQGITEHPADRWVVLSLFVGFVFGGAFVGVWLTRRRAGR
jgi:hypothetical protein